MDWLCMLTVATSWNPIKQTEKLFSLKNGKEDYSNKILEAQKDEWLVMEKWKAQVKTNLSYWPTKAQHWKKQVLLWWVAEDKNGMFI